MEKLKLHRWTFTYIGTDHDVARSALKISITNTMTFEKSESGIMFSLPDEISARKRYSQKIRDNESTEEGYYDKS